VMKIQGLNKVLQNLAEVKATKGKLGMSCETGLKKAGLAIFREAQKEVPVDTGNLKGSGFTRKTKGSGFKAVISVGYTASYAIYVHEVLTNAHGRAYNLKHAKEIASGILSSRGENQKAKFLEDPVKRMRQPIWKIISDELRKGMEG